MISVIVNLYNMRREAARTLHTLSEGYQRGISQNDYEVIVVENGSTDPVGEAFVSRFGPNFRYLDMGAQARPSPAHAVNVAVEQARGDAVGLILDGARMVTPGLLATARDALRLGPETVACTLAWHLGQEHQSISCLKGYSQEVEDDLLASLDWERDGYRLFGCAAWAFSNPAGHFGTIAESCATFLGKSLYQAMGGYSERFLLPGGGYTTLDFFKRCCERPGSRMVLLAGEGSFHQYHGGATTGTGASEYGAKAGEEYLRLMGVPYTVPAVAPVLFGRVGPYALPWLRRSAESAAITS